MSDTMNDLKAKTLRTLIKELDGEEVQASMVAQAINFLKTFKEDLETNPMGQTMKTSDLSGSLKGLAQKYGYDA